MDNRSKVPSTLDEIELLALDAVRVRLKRLSSERLSSGLTTEARRRYEALCRRERDLLRKAAS